MFSLYCIINFVKCIILLYHALFLDTHPISFFVSQLVKDQLEGKRHEGWHVKSRGVYHVSSLSTLRSPSRGVCVESWKGESLERLIACHQSSFRLQRFLLFRSIVASLSRCQVRAHISFSLSLSLSLFSLSLSVFLFSFFSIMLNMYDFSKCFHTSILLVKLIIQTQLKLAKLFAI